MQIAVHGKRLRQREAVGEGGVFVAAARADIVFFFFQAEDGIRDHCVTGVQTCALPISTQSPSEDTPSRSSSRRETGRPGASTDARASCPVSRNSLNSSSLALTESGQEIGRASCRERVESWVVGGSLKTKRRTTASTHGQ